MQITCTSLQHRACGARSAASQQPRPQQRAAPKALPNAAHDDAKQPGHSKLAAGLLGAAAAAALVLSPPALAKDPFLFATGEGLGCHSCPAPPWDRERQTAGPHFHGHHLPPGWPPSSQAPRGRWQRRSSSSSGCGSRGRRRRSRSCRSSRSRQRCGLGASAAHPWEFLPGCGWQAGDLSIQSAAAAPGCFCALDWARSAFVWAGTGPNRCSMAEGVLRGRAQPAAAAVQEELRTQREQLGDDQLCVTPFGVDVVGITGGCLGGGGEESGGWAGPLEL